MPPAKRSTIRVSTTATAPPFRLHWRSIPVSPSLRTRNGSRRASRRLVLLTAQRHLERCLEHQPIAGQPRPESDAQMPGHTIAEPEVRSRVELMLLRSRFQRAVILESQRQLPTEVEPHPRPRLELPLVLGSPPEVALERRIGEQLHRAEPPLENRRQLCRAGALAERRPRRLILGAEAQIHRQAPRLGRAQARAQPPTRVLEPHPRHLGAEDIAGDLPVIRDPAGYLGGEAPLALRGRHGARNAARAATREVEMAFQLPFAAMCGGVGIDGDFEMLLR